MQVKQHHKSPNNGSHSKYKVLYSINHRQQPLTNLNIDDDTKLAEVIVECCNVIECRRDMIHH